MSAAASSRRVEAFTEPLTAILRCVAVLWLCLRIAPTLISTVPSLKYAWSFSTLSNFVFAIGMPTALATCLWVLAPPLARLLLAGVSNTEPGQGSDEPLAEKHHLDVVALRLMAFVMLVRSVSGVVFLLSYTSIRSGPPADVAALFRIVSVGATSVGFVGVLVFAPQIAIVLRRCGSSVEAVG